MTPSIFDDAPRADTSPARHAESRFTFLNRAAGPVFDRVRSLLEGWFVDYPETGRADVRSRLRSDDDRTFVGAFWEMYQAQALRGMGFTLSFHPDVPGTSKHPDFLVEDDGRAFYLETTVASTSNAERAADRRRGTLYDALNQIVSPNFFLGVEIESEGSLAPSTRRLRNELMAWLQSLDPDELMALGDLEAVRDRHSHLWEEAGWRVRIWPIAKSRGRRGKPGRTVGLYSPEGGFVDSKGPIRRAVREKASRYGQLDLPYVVAVLVESTFIDEEDVLDALFGSVAVQIDVVDRARARTVRLRDGAWMARAGPTRTRVSAVLTAINLAPWSIARVRPRVWRNPWATHALSNDLGWAATLANPATGEIEGTEATHTPSEMFRLPVDWPGPEDPFPGES
jgi:hypothetical protein